jgi:WD40 repeat protein
VWHGSKYLFSVAFSPDGRHVAAGDVDGFVRIWNARTSQLVAQCDMGYDWVSVPVRAMIFTLDGKGITVGGCTLQGWDLSSLREVRSGKHVIRDDATSVMNQIYKFKGHDVCSSFAFKFTTLILLFPYSRSTSMLSPSLLTVDG